MSRGTRRWLRRAAGSMLVGALAFGGLVASPAGSSSFPGENGKIAFTRCGPDLCRIVSMNPDGSGQTDLTDPLLDSYTPDWSADGEKIAFGSFRDGNSEIYVMDADGSHERRLTNDPARDADPSWSPDGEQIVFSRGSPEQLYVMDADGTNVRQLTNTAVFNRVPQWSPDGKQIVFSSNRDGNEEIFVMDADGSNQNQITSTAPPVQNLHGHWSPDGEQITFTSNRDGTDHVYVMDADGSNVRRLTNNTALETESVFSPDGEEIAFARSQDGNFDIYVVKADGANEARVTSGPDNDFEAIWQPDAFDGDLRITKVVVGTPPGGATFQVKIDCDGDDNDSTSTFPETGGTQSLHRETFGPLECTVTEPNTGGATTVDITCANAENAECKQNGEFELFDDPGDDKTHIEINVVNTFAVVAEPTFTG